VRILVVTAILATATPAVAGSLVDAIAKHDDDAVAGLRAQLPGDAALRCALGTVYSERNDLSRADLYLAGCDAATLPAELADSVARAVRTTARALRDSDLAGLDIIVEPKGATVDADVDALRGEMFAAPRVVWVPAGHRVVHVRIGDKTYEYASDVKPRDRAPIIVKLIAPTTAAPKTQVANFEEEGGAAGATIQGQPPDVKHDPMKIGMMEKHAAPGGDAIDDPLATKQHRSKWVLGLRAGGGVFDETGGPSRLGPSVAAVASLVLLPRLSLDLRIDWTRRGSDGVDTLGATLGATGTALQLSQLAIRGGAGLRGDIRLETSDVFFPPMGMQYPLLAEVANPANLSAAAWLEVPLQRWPVTIAARYERSLTSLGFSVHDQAVIVEAGFELR
jgi:hypothetical protein